MFYLNRNSSFSKKMFGNFKSSNPFLILESTTESENLFEILKTMETLEERVESVLIWEKLENVSILTRGNIVLSESKFEFLEENVWEF